MRICHVFKQRFTSTQSQGDHARMRARYAELMLPHRRASGDRNIRPFADRTEHDSSGTVPMLITLCGANRVPVFAHRLPVYFLRISLPPYSVRPASDAQPLLNWTSRMLPLTLDHSLVAHAFCFCPFAVATTIPRHCVPWLAVRIVLVAEAIAGFLLSLLAVFLVYLFPAFAQAKPPPAPVKQMHPRSLKRRPKPTPIQTSAITPRHSFPSDSKSAVQTLSAPAVAPLPTPAIVLTSEKGPTTSCTPGLPTVVERIVLHTPPSSSPSSPRSRSSSLSPAPAEANHKATASLHTSSVESEPALKPTTQRCRKGAIEAFARARPVSLPPMARSQSMVAEKSSSESFATPRRNNTFKLRPVRRSLLAEPLRVLSLNPHVLEGDYGIRKGKEKCLEKRKQSESEKQKEKDERSQRSTARTDPYAAPFFFPSPASPDAGQYVAALRERPSSVFSPVASPPPPTSVHSPTVPPAVPLASGSTKGKRRFFGSHKRNKSDVVS